MTSAPDLRAIEVFELVVDLSDGERAKALEDACAGDDALRSDVLRMLAVESEAGFLDVDSAARRATPRAPGVPSGAVFGPFTIVRTLGSGGMGVVYEAEQRMPQRRVALKMLSTSLVRSNAERRFRSEIELLARLDHPAIARVLEAGAHTTADGSEQPYFAMEYVDGASDIVAWGRTRPLRERVTLLAEVCDAIQHGHQQGVVHRDLKPANVLVDGQGRPKVIDFGVARVVDDASDPGFHRTETGEIVGTLTYMAPEQLAGSSGVDTRTDVYALGLILYELIAGRKPYDLGGCTLTEIAHIIRDSPPTPFHRLSVPIPDDLGWIAMRALEKEPERRYPSASELAADLRRFLNHDPVEAGRPSRVYTFKKLVRRHRATSLAIAGVAAAVLVGAGVSVAAMLRARDEADKFRAINDVLTGMFVGVRIEDGGVDVRASELLDRASAQVESFVTRPDLRAPLHLTLSRSYRSLSHQAAAEREARRALELASELAPAERMEAAYLLAYSLLSLDRASEARALVDAALVDPAFERAQTSVRFGLRRLVALVLEHQGAPEEAAAVLEPLLEASRAELAPGADITRVIELSLLEVWIAAGRYSDAEHFARERVAAQGPDLDHIDLGVRAYLARSIALQSRHAEARELLEAYLPDIRSTFGAHHSRTRVALGDLAAAYLMTGDAAQAEPIFAAVADEWEASEGPAHSETLTARANHARALVALGDTSAEEQLKATYEGRERMFGTDDARTRKARFEWARALRQSGRLTEAEPELIALDARAREHDFAKRHRYRAELAMLRLNQGRPEEAADLMADAWEGLARTEGEHSVETLLVGTNLGGSLLESGRSDEGIEVWNAVLSGMRESFDEDDVRLCVALTNLAGAHAQRGEPALALERLSEALEWANRFLPDDHERRLELLHGVGGQLVAMGRAEEALPHLKELASRGELDASLGDRDRGAFHLAYARALAASGNLEEAVEAFELVLEMEHASSGGPDDERLQALEGELQQVLDRL